LVTASQAHVGCATGTRPGQRALVDTQQHHKKDAAAAAEAVDTVQKKVDQLTNSLMRSIRRVRMRFLSLPITPRRRLMDRAIELPSA